MRRIRLYGLLVRVLLSAMMALTMQSALAQANRATITGTVTDTSGAIVPGVEVTATNSGTGVFTKTASNGAGIYSLLNLPPGTYAVIIKKEGFKPVEFSRVTLIVDQVAALNATLTVGAISDAITVTADSPVLETETGTVGTNMNGNVVTDLPLNAYGGRQAEYFAVALTPGYSPSSSPYLAIINGTQGFTKDFTVDGTSGTANLQGDTFEVGPSMEAIEEMQAETSGLSAKNGITNGGVMMYNLRSGTNKFHGSAFGYGHNEFLDANTWANGHTGDINVPGSTTTRKGKSRFWDYGFSAGGPIIKDKTFIFGTFERYQQFDFTPGGFGSASTVPTQAFLQGNLSSLLVTSNLLGTDVHGNPIYQGAIFNPSDPGAVFVGNVIPSDMISGVSQKITALYQKFYTPERDGLIPNDRLPGTNTPSQTPNQIVIKVDHNLTQNDRLSGSWIYNHRPRTLVDSGGVWAPGTTDGGPLTNSRLQFVKAHEFRLSEAHTFSPTLLNVANATYNWYWNGSLPTSTTNWPSELGFGNTGANNFPQIDFGRTVDNAGGTGFGETAIGNTWSGNWVAGTYIYGDQLIWTKGRHSFTFGGDFRAMQINSHAASGQLSLRFDPDTTGAPTQPYSNQVGFGFASFLLGDVQNAQENTPYNLYGRRKAMSLFAQDDFKVTRKLTLNLGLRWDATFRFHEKNGNWASFDLNAIDPNLGIKGAILYAKNGKDSFERKEDWKNFGPSIGFAYNPWDKVVFRGAFSILYVPIGIQYYEGVPYGFDPGLRGTNTAGAFNWDGGYPGVFVPGTKTTTPDPSLFPIASVDPRSLLAGYTDNFNIGVQYALSQNTRIEATYIGNRGHRLQDSNLAYNEPDPKTFFNLFNNNPNFYSYICDPATAAADAVPYPYAGFCAPAYAAIAPYPQVATGLDTYWFYPNLYYVGLPLGQSYYNSMVLHLVKRTGHGLMADVSYTLSKQQGDTFNNLGDNYDTGLFGIQDYTNLKEAAQTLSVYDQKHVVKAGIEYELPMGRGHKLFGGVNQVVNKIVSGWKISPLLLYATGRPLSFYSSTTGLLGYPAWSAVYVNYNLGNYHGRLFDPGKFPDQNQYLPTDVVSDPTLGQLGSGPSRVGALRTFGQDSEDIAVHKYFKVGKDGQYSLDCAVEFYNIFNRHGFADPSTSIGPQFGQVLGDSGAPRNGQFEARFRW